jgi:hypothetical protein
MNPVLESGNKYLRGVILAWYTSTAGLESGVNDWLNIKNSVLHVVRKGCIFLTKDDLVTIRKEWEILVDIRIKLFKYYRNPDLMIMPKVLQHVESQLGKLGFLFAVNKYVMFVFRYKAGLVHGEPSRNFAQRSIVEAMKAQVLSRVEGADDRLESLLKRKDYSPVQVWKLHASDLRRRYRYTTELPLHNSDMRRFSTQDLGIWYTTEIIFYQRLRRDAAGYHLALPAYADEFHNRARHMMLPLSKRKLSTEEIQFVDDRLCSEIKRIVEGHHLNEPFLVAQLYDQKIEPEIRRLVSAAHAAENDPETLVLKGSPSRDILLARLKALYRHS